MTWNDQFLTLFRRCVDAYKAGNSDFGSYYSDEDLKFLEAIGYKPRELFDFVEDLVDEGAPTESSALLIAAARRDYFYAEQDGVHSDREIDHNDIPERGEELDGLAYLPRIIAKTRAKLRGELDPDLMFSCGGDRSFLARHGDINSADFLRHVWAAKDNDQAIADFVHESMSD
ncbi:MAG: DUF5069 domain-containing protein [Akkermansiaceae bacterium]|jgi:hypothetical protein|nr:DUF5069 domain-containing protein [Akkermansiaceae bacterium]